MTAGYRLWFFLSFSFLADTSNMSRVFTKDEVSVHNLANDLLLIIDGNVYDVTRFQHEHP